MSALSTRFFFPLHRDINKHDIENKHAPSRPLLLLWLAGLRLLCLLCLLGARLRRRLLRAGVDLCRVGVMDDCLVFSPCLPTGTASWAGDPCVQTLPFIPCPPPFLSPSLQAYLDEEDAGLVLVEKSGRAEGAAVGQDYRLHEGAETMPHLLKRACRCVCVGRWWWLVVGKGRHTEMRGKLAKSLLNDDGGDGEG